MDFRTPEGQQRYDALVDAAATAVVGLDFDGTLSPIVEDPATAVIHPDAPAVLAGLASVVRAVAIVTGRPARQVVDLGRLEEVAAALPDGCTVYVLGQYGNERWDSTSRVFSTPEPPEGLAAFGAELPAILAACDASAAFVEDKGLALVVHTRRLPDGDAAYLRLEPALTDAAERHGLVLQQAKQALEVRAPGSHKGDAVHLLADELRPGAVLFVGDDLGDIEAFEAVRGLRDRGLPGLLVCSGSQEQDALCALSDLVVDGPAGTVGFLRRYADDARRQHAR
ncbi:MAG: trehalose-phosphatase [Nocardioidaceae bacterium]